MMGRVRITIELLDQPKAEPAVIEMDYCTISMGNGVHQSFDGQDVEARWSENGQRRFMIKAWKGCETYESFRAETSEIP